MKPEQYELFDFLFDEMEKKDQRIFELQDELIRLLNSDDELLNNASSKIEELELQCSELVKALKTCLEYLEKGPQFKTG